MSSQAATCFVSHQTSSQQLIERLNSSAQPPVSSKCHSEHRSSSTDDAFGNGYRSTGAEDDLARSLNNFAISSNNPFRTHAAATNSNPFAGSTSISNPFRNPGNNTTSSRASRPRHSETPAAHPGYGNGHAPHGDSGYLQPGQLNPLQRGNGRREQIPAVSSGLNRIGASQRRSASSQSRQPAPPVRAQSAMAFSFPHFPEQMLVFSTTYCQNKADWIHNQDQTCEA